MKRKEEARTKQNDTEAAIQAVMKAEGLTREKAIASIMAEGLAMKALRVTGQVIHRRPDGTETEITDEHGQFKRSR